MMAGPTYAPPFAEYWKPPTDFYGQPVYGGTLRINYEDPLAHANVWGAWAGYAVRLRAPTHNGLLMENPYDAYRPFIPDLASGWTIHDDSQGVTFFLREGVKWHNGAELTCEDARFTIETLITVKGLTSSYLKSRLTNVDLNALECEDDLTLKVRFTAPTPTPLLALSSYSALVFNKEWFEAGGEDAMFQDVSVGTGAFKWAPGQEVGVDTQRFERNPDYFIKELPYLDELVIVGIVDESAQQAAMLAHQTDWHWVRNWGQYDAYVDHDQIMTVVRNMQSNPSLWLNKRKPPFDNVRVRQAIYMGIDREAGIALLMDGHASLDGFIMPASSRWALDRERGCAVPAWCQPDDMEAQRAEARQILEEEGFDFNKTYILTVETDNQVVARATFIQEQLRLLGIKTDFDMVESVAYRQQRTDGTWGDFLPNNESLILDDPGLGMGHHFRCVSIWNFWTPGTECDQKMEGLLDQVDSTIDPAERKRISDEIQLYAMKQYWKFPLYWEQEAVAFWPEVRGYTHFPTSQGSFLKYYHMWIDPAHKDDKGFKEPTTGVPGGIY
jgi:peptide/nickel transport system substrate-binding protein